MNEPVSRRGPEHIEVFVTLQFDLHEAGLPVFSERALHSETRLLICGWERHRKPYSVFIIDLERKSAALSTLYHVLLPSEIQINASVAKRWLCESVDPGDIKANFVEVGILDPSMLKR